MFVDFKSLSKDSRVWIFQSIQMIDNTTIEKIKSKLKLFLDNWKSHQMNFKSSFDIRNNTFIIIAAAESDLVSGCSIDSLIKFIKELECLFDLQLMDKLHVKYTLNDEIQTNCGFWVYEQNNGYTDKIEDSKMYNLVNDEIEMNFG